MPYEPILTHQHITTCLIVSFAAAVAVFDAAVFWYQTELLSKIFFDERHLMTWLSNWYTLIMCSALAIGLPIGGVLFGWLGDRLGRKSSLIYSSAIVSIATIGLLCLPTSQHFGHLPAVILGALRFIQGIGCGAILPIAFVIIAETLPTKRIGMGSGLILASVVGGLMILGILLNIINNSFSLYELISYAWRIPHAISAALSIIGLWLLSKLSETPVFLSKNSVDAQQNGQLISQIHLADSQSLHKYLPPPNLIAAIILSLIAAALLILIPVLFLPMYEISFINSASAARFGGYVGLLFMLLGCIFYGAMADLNNAGRVLMMAGILLLIFSAGFIYHVQNGGGLVLVFFTLLGFATGLIGAVPAVMTRLFPTKHRLRGVAITLTMAYACIIALLPFVTGQFLLYTAYTPLLYVMFIGLVTVFISFYIYYIPRTAQDLNR